MAAPYVPDPEHRRIRFQVLLEQLSERLDQLLASRPYLRDRRPPVPHVAGVYLFSERETHLYVGRTKDVNARLGQHVASGSTHNQAAFAFNIARREAAARGRPINGLTRKRLGEDSEFVRGFFAPAKSRVRAMNFRFVEIDPDHQDADALSTLMEVFTSVRLGTEGDFNLFGTH
jgi:hypothetical protein